MYSGIQFTVAFALSNCGRSSSTAMNQSSTTRKIRGVWHRQQCG
jgi:hypothetical protein